MDWYYANEQDEQIQVTEDELKALAQGGTIRPDTLVWNATMSDWKPCQELNPDWFSHASSGATTPLPGAAPSSASAPASGSSVASSSIGGPVASSPSASTPTLPPRAPQQAADGLAIASLICGIVGLVFLGCYGFGIIFSLAAVVCGHLCRKRLVASGDTSSAGMALAGLITGYISIALFAIGILIVIIFVGFAAVSPTMVMIL